MREGLPRRRFMVSVGLLGGSRLWAGDPKTDLPTITKRVEKVFKAPCKEPNDLAFVPEGLWILYQVDPNKAFSCTRKTALLSGKSRPSRFTAAGSTRSGFAG